jgi:hypothetical protein
MLLSDWVKALEAVLKLLGEKKRVEKAYSSVQISGYPNHPETKGQR